MQDFLPVTREDMKSRGWDELDFVYVTGSLSLTGERRRASRCSGNRAWVFSLQQETWIPW